MKPGKYDDEKAEFLDQLNEDWEVAMEKGEYTKAFIVLMEILKKKG